MHDFSPLWLSSSQEQTTTDHRHIYKLFQNNLTHDLTKHTTNYTLDKFNHSINILNHMTIYFINSLSKQLLFIIKTMNQQIYETRTNTSKNQSIHEKSINELKKNSYYSLIDHLYSFNSSISLMKPMVHA